MNTIDVQERTQTLAQPDIQDPQVKDLPQEEYLKKAATWNYPAIPLRYKTLKDGEE